MSVYAAANLSAGYPYRSPSWHRRAGGPFQPARAAFRMLTTWQARLAERADLAAAPAARLRDMGIDAAGARREADKPFWRA